MTREGIKEYLMQINEAPEPINRWKPDILCELIDQIYDDFEKRTCSTCIHCHNYSPTKTDHLGNPFLECSLITYLASDLKSECLDVDKDFYCNRYEPR